MIAQNEQNLFQQYLNEIKDYPLLDIKEEKALLKNIQNGNKRALNKLVQSNLRFVVKVAMVYQGQGLTLMELINEGNIGLMEAGKRFDLNNKVKFISYAVWWIRQSILKAISEKARLVRISSEKELVIRQLSKKNVSIDQTIGGHITANAEELAKGTKYSPEQIEKIIKMGQWHSSLDSPIKDGKEDLRLMDVTKCDNLTPEEETTGWMQTKYIHKYMGQLNDQEQSVLKLYFGLDRNYNLNLRDIGKVIGLSKERVRQIKDKALGKLKTILSEEEVVFG